MTRPSTLLAALVVALSLTACGGGGSDGVADRLEAEKALVAEQERRLQALEAGSTDPGLLVAFNAAAVMLQGMRLDTGWLCGPQGGRQESFTACLRRLEQLRTLRSIP